MTGEGEGPVDDFRSEDLKELLEAREGPAISIYLPTSRAGTDRDGDRLRFRAAVRRAGELIGSDTQGGRGSVLTELEPLLADQEFWLRQADGLAVFRAAAFTRVYRLPTAFPELVVVGPSFHTRPLVQFLQAPDRFWILGLSHKEVRLWQGTAAGLRRVEPDGVPWHAAEAVSQYVDYGEETFHSSRGAGHLPSYHGHGAGRDSLAWMTESFFRKVDAGLRERLEPRAGPVILAGVEEHLSLFRSVSRLRALSEETIRGNVLRWTPDQLREAAAPIVERIAEEKVDEGLRLWEAAFRPGKTETDLAASARLAVAGRVRLVMTQRDRRLWGTLDRRTGAVCILGESEEDPGNQAVELLDELAEVVLLHGGEALAVPGARMPTRTGVATILR